jgi:hypothetical protein
MEEARMRVVILITALFASSFSLALAQEPAKPPVTAEPGQEAQQPKQQERVTAPEAANPDRGRERDQNLRDRDDRPMGGDWKTGRRDREMQTDRETRRDRWMHDGDGDRMGRDDCETGPDRRMHRDRMMMGHDYDTDRGRYGEPWDRDRDRADRGRDHPGYFDEDRPRRRVKICIEYQNGEEYCRYRE